MSLVSYLSHTLSRTHFHNAEIWADNTRPITCIGKYNTIGMTRESLVSPAQLRGLSHDTIIQEAGLSSQLV